MNFITTVLLQMIFSIYREKMGLQMQAQLQEMKDQEWLKPIHTFLNYIPEAR